MTPPFLQHNDEIRIVSPSGFVEPALIDGAEHVLKSWGLDVTVGKYACEKHGRFAGTSEQRTEDLQAALDDANVKAIFCSRGGYGLAQIVDKLKFHEFIHHPKWIVGFSDITALHNAVSRLGVSSLHAIMAKHLMELPYDSQPVTQLHHILFGELPAYTIPSHVLNKGGEARGRLVGGNLSVLMGLRGTPFDLEYDNNILFIEDVGEKPYHIDRMMQNLRLSGVLNKISGLVVGQFSHLEDDPLMMMTTYEVIYNVVTDYDIPVCFDFPVGHVDENLPLIVNAEVCLNVSDERVLLMF
nr:LD-carboxypeptidase [Paludibacter sp. 221]